MTIKHELLLDYSPAKTIRADLPAAIGGSLEGGAAPGQLMHDPTGQVLHFKLSDLLDFLQGYSTTEVALQMRCPYLGVPLPSVRVDAALSLGLTGSLEFSLPLAERLLEHMLSQGALRK